MIACKIKLKLCFHLGKWLYCSEAVWILTLFSQCRYAVFSETSLNHWVFDSGSGSRALRCRSHGTVRAAVPVTWYSPCRGAGQGIDADTFKLQTFCSLEGSWSTTLEYHVFNLVSKHDLFYITTGLFSPFNSSQCSRVGLAMPSSNTVRLLFLIKNWCLHYPQVTWPLTEIQVCYASSC